MVGKTGSRTGYDGSPGYSEPTQEPSVPHRRLWKGQRRASPTTCRPGRGSPPGAGSRRTPLRAVPTRSGRPRPARRGRSARPGSPGPSSSAATTLNQPTGNGGRGSGRPPGADGVGHYPEIPGAKRPANARRGRSALVTMPGGAATTDRMALQCRHAGDGHADRGEASGDEKSVPGFGMIMCLE